MIKIFGFLPFQTEDRKFNQLSIALRYIEGCKLITDY